MPKTARRVTRWRDFRKQHPGFHQIAPGDSAAAIRYHLQRATKLARLGNARGAAWHREMAEAAE